MRHATKRKQFVYGSILTELRRPKPQWLRRSVESPARALDVRLITTLRDFEEVCGLPYGMEPLG